VLAADQLERAFQRERARVERNEQCFSLAVFRVPEGKTVGTVREVVARTAEVLLKRIRTYDDVGLVDDRSLAVLLPETTGAATWIFVDGALEDLNSNGLHAACEVYTYPHPDNREEPRSNDSESEDAYGKFGGDYGRVEHPPVPSQDEGEQPSASAERGEHISDRKLSHDSVSVKPLRRALRRGEGWRMSETGSLQSALSGTAVLQRTTLRAVRSQTAESGDRSGIPSGISPGTVGLSAGSSALATIRAPRPEAGSSAAKKSAAPVQWRRPVAPSPEQPTDTREVRDLAPYFEERLPFYRRAVDVLVAGTALTLLSPVLLAGAVMVKVTSPGPIIFAQPRAGRGGRPFQFYKLRSMYQDAEDRKNALRLVNEKDGPIFKIKNDPRITPVGKIIRKFSIDELPQLFNVLKGDMTLVGPRPPVLDEVKEYETWQRQRLDITGGITCIWQVSGRSEVTFREWMRMDVRYRKQRTLGLDLKLIWKTFGAVFSGKGAY
jgi:lipopolysaccharide/colanic/teichoic acid biosynthesis glycosyltransferase